MNSFTMAAIAKLQVLKQAPLLITPSLLFEDYPTICVSSTHTDATNNQVEHKADLPFCPDPSDKGVPHSYGP